MFDGLINIKTLEGSALSGNAVPPTHPRIYQGASHQGKLGPSRYVVLTVHFVRMLSQLWKSLRGFILLHRGLALQKFFFKKACSAAHSSPLAARRAEQCEGSLFISKASSGSGATEICLCRISLL